jgi:AAHS family 4-hydroxybenzoate transporter-like MFS transporter
MAESGTIDIGRLVDEQKIGWFNVALLVLSFLAIMGDGYDILALAFAAPDIVKSWHVDRAAFGPVFSASLFGILFGAPILGYVGDRFGRKKAIVIGCLVYGVFTLASMGATSLTQLAILRFLTGLGLGGLMPNTIALNAEFAPKRLRGTLVIIMFTGITLGGAIPGWIASSLLPTYGWQSLFFVGGVGPIIIAIILALVMPESIKFLVYQPHRRAELVRLAGILKPGFTAAPDARFTIAGEEKKPPFTIGLLFKGGLSVITPLLWLLFAINLMAFYFLNSWMPIVFQGAGLSPENAALTLSMFQVGGTVGGLLLSVLIDRFGMIAVFVLFVLSCPIVAVMGTPGLAVGQLIAVVTAAGFCVLGLQFGINAISGLIYPTAFRSNGSGWAFAIGRFGSIVGPILGGILIGMHLPAQQLFYFPAIMLAVGAVAAFVLMRLCVARFRGYHLDDKAATPAPAE